jgi:serine O-acetyltransferase
METINLDFLNSRLNHFSNLFSLVPNEPGREVDLREAISDSIRDLHYSAQFIRDPYHDPAAILSGAAFLHSDLLANLILRVSSHLQQNGLTSESHSLSKANKALHGVDFFPTSVIPAVFQLVHPVGSVIGRAQLSSFTVVYQGVSVGARIPSAEEGAQQYPSFQGPVILFARSAVFGNSSVGANVVFGADSMIIDQDVPADSIVVGRYPNHRILSGADKIFQKFFYA